MADMKFKKLAEQRTNRILNDVRLLEIFPTKEIIFIQEQVESIFTAIERQYATKEKFHHALKDGGSLEKFTL